MASNKKTTEPCFSNGTEMMVWQDKNCCQCLKYTTYNEKLGRYPQFRCAVQRDIELQAAGLEEISQRSYDACRQNVCPFLKPKDGDVEVMHREQGRHVAPKPTKVMPLFKEQAPINILKEAEKTIRQREAEVDALATAEREREAQKERNKALDMALAKAYDRRMNRGAIATLPNLATKRKDRAVITPELQATFNEKGRKMKKELDDIVRIHLSNYHIVIHGLIDVGDGIMQDCIREIKKRGKYKFEMKKQINLALSAYGKVSARLSAVTTEVADLRNMVLDTLYDEVQNDIKLLTYSMKVILDKHRVKDSMLIANVDTAWSLFELARQTSEFIHLEAWSMLKAVFGREKVPIPSGFREELDAFFFGKKPDAIAKEWQKVSELITPTDRKIADELTNDMNVKNALKIIQRKMCDMQKIENLSNDIIENNPQIIDDYKKSHPEWNETVEIAV